MILTENISSIQTLKFQVILCRPLFNFAIHHLYPEDMHTSLQCLALWGKYLEPRVLHPNESMYSNLQDRLLVRPTIDQNILLHSMQCNIQEVMASYIHYISSAVNSTCQNTDYGHPDRAFFQKSQTVGLGQTNWAEIC